MKKKYNLALIPIMKAEEIINLSQVFSNIADKYLLGENSLPHVTLYQIEVEDNAIRNIWENVCKKWKQEPINLIFEHFSCLTFDNDIHWVSLLPSNSEILHKMHRKIADIIEQPIRENFDPHMTLINTKNKNCEKEIHKVSYNPIKDNFVLRLGYCDEVGQFTKVIY